MAEESSKRIQGYMKTGCNAFENKRPVSKPLGFWTDQDILKYLKENNIDYAKCYGEIKQKDSKLELTKLNRTGCMFCMYGLHLEGTPNRFDKMKETHPKIYNYCMNNLGLREIIQYIESGGCV